MYYEPEKPTRNFSADVALDRDYILGPPACWGLRPQTPAAFSQTVLTLQCWCLFVLLYNLENLDLLKGKKYDYSTLKGYFCIYIAL